MSELSIRMLNELIDKIICYEGQGKGKSRTQKIEIFWNGIGHIDIKL